MEENKQPEKNQNQENATKSSTPNNTEAKPRRDRPDRPKRAGNPHRRPKTSTQPVKGNVVKEATEVNGNVHATTKEVDGNREKPKRNPNHKPQKKAQHKKTPHKKPEQNKHGKPTGNKPNHNKNKKPNRNGGGRRPKKFVPGPMSEEMKASILENLEVNDLRMNPWKQINMDNNNKVRFTPLGGLGEIGGNMAVMEDDESAFVIDVGMSFPDETMHGVDILVPDFSYLHAIKDKIVAVIITHAHEDHIGAVPYLFKELQFPLWGTPLALAMIENKFQEHGLMEHVNKFHYVTKRKQYEIGSFKIEWMHNTHSIIDACSLAIESKVGTFIHTADFKVDHTPIDNHTTFG